MTHRPRRAAPSLLVLAGLVGCTALAPTTDYATYRAYRYEAAGPDRLAAGARYLQEYPQGRFHVEVQHEVQGAEEDFWSDHRSSVDGLTEYLHAFPAGLHVDEAHQRLGVFDAARREQETARRAAQAADAARVAAELSQQSARQRLWARLTFARWLRVFSGMQGWGQGMGVIAGQNPNFEAQFEGSPPVCHGAHCRKDARVDFTIPVPGRTAQSSAVTFTLDIVRVGTERSVNQVFLTVHNLGLSHWWESEHQAPVDLSDTTARESSARWAMDQLRAELLAVLPTARETPAELYGPPPAAVMQGIDEDENAAPEPVDPNACEIPSQPLGTRWSAVIGCGTVGGASLTAPPEAVEAHAHSVEGDSPAPPVEPHACLRVDSYAAIAGAGMSTDEGMVVSLIPACALQPAAPGRPGHRAAGHPVAHPAAPHAPAHTAH